MKRFIQTERQRAFVSALGAFLLWGTWAALAHKEFPLGIIIKSALTQGMTSFSFTYIGSMLLEKVVAKWGDTLPKTLLSGLAAFIIILVSVVGIHLVAETPNIALTIAPSMTLSFFYCLSYAVALRKLSKIEVINNL